MRFMMVRGVLPLTLTGIVCIVLFWIATPAAHAASMLDLWYLAPWYAGLGLLISVMGWLSNERQYRAVAARRDEPPR